MIIYNNSSCCTVEPRTIRALASLSGHACTSSYQSITNNNALTLHFSCIWHAGPSHGTRWDMRFLIRLVLDYCMAPGGTEGPWLGQC